MRPLGLTPFDVHLIQIAKGSSYPLMYGELGAMVNSLLKKKRIVESAFRSRFLAACRKGLVTPVDEAQMSVHWRDRRYTITPRGEQAIRDFQIATGGAYRFYKYWDGTNASLDKFMGNKISLGPSKAPTRGQIFADHNRNPAATRKVY